MKEIIQKLIRLGWKPAPYSQPEEHDFYLYKEFEVSQARELSNFTNYTPKNNELLYIMYEIYPNSKKAQYCIWSSEDDRSDVIFQDDDYDTVVELALQDRLFTYPHWLERIAADKGITLNQWAKAANLHHSVLYRIVDRKTEPEGLQVATAEALAKGIGITLDEFLEYAKNKNKKSDG